MAVLSFGPLERWQIVEKNIVFYFFWFVFIYRNVNTVFNITYKDNEHLAVKCVLRSLGVEGILQLFWKDSKIDA